MKPICHLQSSVIFFSSFSIVRLFVSFGRLVNAIKKRKEIMLHCIRTRMTASNSSQRFSYQCRLHIYSSYMFVIYKPIEGIPCTSTSTSTSIYVGACILFRVKLNIFSASSYEYSALLFTSLAADFPCLTI